MPKFSAYMRGEGTKGDTGEAAGFGNVTASVTTSLPYGSTPQVNVEKSGENTALNLDFQFGLVEGEAAGFSTNQKSNIEFISVTSNPSVSITTDNTSPNNSKVFNFDFKIPEPLGISEITAVTTTTSEGINEIIIWYNNGTTTSFNISNGAQGETGFIEGEVATTTELPTQGNHIGRGFLVGQEGAKHLFVYLNNEWTDQGLILGAGFGEPTSSAESIPTTSLSTTSGSLVHITDAAAMPVDSLTVGIEPVQGGSGTPAPDNVRPISGHATATVTRTGANLLDLSPSIVSTNANVDKSVTVTDTGTVIEGISTTNAVNKSFYIRLDAKLYIGQTLTMSGHQEISGGANANSQIRAYTGDSFSIIGQSSDTDFSITAMIPECDYIRLHFGITNSTSGTTGAKKTVTNLMLSVGNVALPWQPYQGHSVTIDLDGTRYGGTVDIKTGIMTLKALPLETTWGSGGSTQVGTNCTKRTISYYGVDAAVFKYKAESSVDISNILPFEYSNADKPHFYVSDSYDSAYHRQYIAVWMPNGTPDSTTLQFWLALRPEYYQTVQLTPAQLSLLQGENNIWSNTGDIEVTYAKMNEPSVEVTVDPESPESAKIFDFNFKIPQGQKGDKGDTPIIELSTSVTSLPQNTDPTLSLTTLGENNFRFDFGLPKGFVQEMTATATANDLEPGSDASATVTVDQNNLNFTFGIPQGIIGKNGIGVSTVEFEGQSLTTGGNIYTMNFAEPDSDTMAFSTIFEAPQGPEGIGFYQKLEFTSTSTNIWIDGENGTSTLIIDRTVKEIIPINIYNSTSNNIAATFTLADPTAQYPHGSIQYNTNEKFDGTLYYIGESPTPQVEIGSVTTVAGTTASVIASKNGHNTVLDFVFPTKGDKGDTGTSIASVTYDHEADNKTYYKMLFTDSTSTLFAVDKGDKGDTGEQGVKGDTGEAAGFGTPTISVNSLAEGQTPTAQITATGDNTSKIFSFTFGIPKGDKGDQGIQGVKGDQGNGVTNISAPVVDGLTKTYTITYGNNDNTTSFSVEDGLAATISFSSGVIIDNTIQQPTAIIEGTSTNPLVTFKFPDSYGSDLKYTASTADFPENGSLTTGYFYFQYEEE